MNEKIIREDGQEVFVVSQQTTTFTKHSGDSEGHQISSVKITIGDLQLEVRQHHVGGVINQQSSPTIGIHDLGGSEITIHQRVVKKQTTSEGHTWTDIKAKGE